MSHTRTLLPRALLIAPLLALLSACGGGGDSTGSTSLAIVTSAGVSAPRYGQTLLLTLNGSLLDSGIAVASPGCRNITRSTTAPNISTAATAYYSCTPSTLGAQTFTVTRTLDNAVLTTAPFTVPAPQVTMTVSNGAGVAGSMVITLAPDRAPVTVDNFLGYVNSSFYNGTIFHRVIAGFVIQGGGLVPGSPLPTLKTPTQSAIVLETAGGLNNVQWSIAMARTSVLNSATSQFFINLVNNVTLDPNAGSAGYAVFGNVSANTALVSAIVAAPCQTGTGISECLPNPTMVITAAAQTQ